MVKPEWGTKRACQSCGARFYDLGRDPIICPKCGGTVEPEVLIRVRRASAPAESKAKKAAQARPANIEAVADTVLDVEEAEVLDDEDGAVELDDEEDDDALIEDTSEIGEDEDDMAEVLDYVEEEEEER